MAKITIWEAVSEETFLAMKFSRIYESDFTEEWCLELLDADKKIIHSDYFEDEKEARQVLEYIREDKEDFFNNREK